MVCDKCEAKLSKVVTPDPWKTGARNVTEGNLISTTAHFIKN